MGIGVDIVSGAAAKARENAEELGLSDRATFLVGNWLSSMSGSFDVIVCNPPYIRRSEIDKLQPEVRLFDPKRALDGGADGLAAYRELIPKCEEHLAVGGLLVFEIGASQDEAVAEIFLASGLHRIEGHRDLTGCVRCLSATAP
jgi:release factor glutamine methyltransferase